LRPFIPIKHLLSEPSLLELNIPFRNQPSSGCGTLQTSHDASVISDRNLEQTMQVTIRVFLLMSVFMCTLSNAQTSGEITYQETTQLKDLLKDQPAAIRALLPDESTSWLSVQFIDNRYRIENKTDQPDANRTNIQINTSVGGGSWIVDLNQQSKILFGTASDINFQIPSELAAPKNLVLLNESKQILGYPSKKATLKLMPDDQHQATIWYTESIPVSIGPIAISGIPGAILSLETGNTLYKVTEIALRDIDPIALQVPTDHREITQQQHQDLIEEQIEAISGGQRTVIRR